MFQYNYLVLGKVLRIGEFINEAPKLRYMVGASRIVGLFSKELVEAASKHVDPKHEIYLSTAGEFIVGFSSKTSADRFAQLMNRCGSQFFGAEYFRISAVSGVSCIEELQNSFFAMKTGSVAFSAEPSLQHMKKCDVCDAWGVPEKRTYSDNSVELLCSRCAVKMKARCEEDLVLDIAGLRIIFSKDISVQSSADVLRIPYPEYSHQLENESSFTDIGDSCRTRKKDIALIYADGNSMGRLFSNHETYKSYKELSDKVERYNDEAVDAAFNAVDPDGNKGILLFKGGDDLMAVVPADVAMEFAEKYMAELTKEGTPFANGVSVGVVYSPAKIPVTHLFRTVNQLLKSAKFKAWRDRESGMILPSEVSTVDFSVGSVFGPLEELPERSIAGEKDELSIPTARPYSYVEFKKLKFAVDAIRKSSIGNSKINRLRKIFSENNTPEKIKSALAGFMEREWELHKTITADLSPNRVLKKEKADRVLSDGYDSEAVTRFWPGDMTQLSPYVYVEEGNE